MEKAFVKRTSRAFCVQIGKAVGSRIVLSGHGPREIRSEKAFVKRTSRALAFKLVKRWNRELPAGAPCRSASAVSRDTDAEKLYK